MSALNEKSNVFLVPTDFTKVADCAVNHALHLAKSVNGTITLLHVVGKEKEVADVKEKIEVAARSIESSNNIKVSTIVKVGNIFDDIGGVAKEIDAKLIIMGTHGVKGFQHITGSYALKVITNSDIPFVVVQERNIKDGYKNILLPMDMTKDSKQKISLTISMAKFFNSKVFIFAANESDEWFRNAIKRNTAFAKAELQMHRVECEVVIAEEKGNFVKQFLKFASSNNADLIAIMTENGSGITDAIVGNDEVDIITNDAQIPVMCMNPIETGFAGSVLFG